MRICGKVICIGVLAYSSILSIAQSATRQGTAEQGSSREAQTQVIHNASIRVSFSREGAYSITRSATHQGLQGKLPAATNSLRIATGTDAIGQYREIEAQYGKNNRTAIIRLYSRRSSVILLDKHKGTDPNAAPFPAFHIFPEKLMRFSYQAHEFSPIDFGKLDAQGPWVFFDSKYNTMILSPADSFLVSDLKESSEGQMQSGIDSQIATLPTGFTHRTLLAFGAGVNRTLAAWGMDLQKLGHKHPISNDADVVLNKFGYWTDHGASYYYRFDPKLGYEGTLLAVRDQYRQLGVLIAYLQLDSWWYPKERGALGNGDNGTIVYRANPKIFPDGLESFHERLGLPFVTHARGISHSSPYRKKYRMSNDVIIDSRYWDSTAKYLKKSGVAVYEQDWLSDNARPAIDIAQSHAFLAEMSKGMAQENIGIQYCMPMPAFYMASTQFQNVRTIRTGDDRFKRSLYDDFLYTSAFARALGLWPWSDVFMSDELPSLVISTLSAGPVGTGDALGMIDAANLKRVMRADSVILKPDNPLLPIDSLYLADATAGQKPLTAPMIAVTQTDFGTATEKYVFSYPRNADRVGTTVSLSELGIEKPVYAWDWVARKGRLILAGGNLQMHDDNGWSYEVLVPVNKSGIALIGDVGKIVPLARKRFTSVSDNGAMEATISFAAGESSVTLTGYAEHEPQVSAVAGKVRGVHYDSPTHLFSFDVERGTGATAKIRIQ